MVEPDMSLEMLSAYVDGELGNDEAALLADRAANDPRIARQIASLHALRAGVAGLGSDVQLVAPTIAPHGHEGRGLRRAGGLLAAAAVIAIIAGAGWWTSGGDLAPLSSSNEADNRMAALSPQPGLTRLIESYDAWRQSAVDDAAPAISASSRIAKLLSATGLRFAHERYVQLADGAIAHETGYLGKNGCRLSVAEIPRTNTAAVAAKLKISTDGTLLSASWDAPHTRYVLIARAMDRVRFVTIASSLNAATISSGADEDMLVSALAGAHQHCLG